MVVMPAREIQCRSFKDDNSCSALTPPFSAAFCYLLKSSAKVRMVDLRVVQSLRLMELLRVQIFSVTVMVHNTVQLGWVRWMRLGYHLCPKEVSLAELLA